MTTTQVSIATNYSSAETMHIHKVGCREISHNNGYSDPTEANCPIEVADFRECVLAIYGPEAGSFFEESGFDPNDPNAWKQFAFDFRVFPCVKNLPYNIHDTNQ